MGILTNLFPSLLAKQGQQWKDFRQYQEYLEKKYKTNNLNMRLLTNEEYNKYFELVERL